MRCVFRDALLHTTVVMRGYLRYCHLPVSFDQSGPSPLTSLINNAFLPAELLLTGCFLFFTPFSANSRDCCAWKSQEISSFWDTQTTLSGTNNHSTVKVTLITFLPISVIWSEKQLNLLTMSACFYAFSCCHMIGWLNICPRSPQNTARPGPCITKQDYRVRWITARSKTWNPHKSGTWTEVKRDVPGFTQISYPANYAIQY